MLTNSKRILVEKYECCKSADTYTMVSIVNYVAHIKAFVATKMNDAIDKHITAVKSSFTMRK